MLGPATALAVTRTGPSGTRSTGSARLVPPSVWGTSPPQSTLAPAGTPVTLGDGARAHGLLVDEPGDARREAADDQAQGRHAVRRGVAGRHDHAIAGERVVQRDGERACGRRDHELLVHVVALCLGHEDARSGRGAAGQDRSRERGVQAVAEGHRHGACSGSAEADIRAVRDVEGERIAIGPEVGDAGLAGEHRARRAHRREGTAR